ncbi:MAG: phosphoglycolate phosphatase [Eubacteriaceae bacterium]|jgi:phosphoglycolate phosphatase|nr:phosphoglycolate phosphatase [Eubacteriaceae bacterium]MDK2904227.1 phosphoglycolate phosphatase [Eubacteriaceae bacterium]MDN5306740.1 phosphoglycolate phosphatase [Eubacteriaceae bacterium]
MPYKCVIFDFDGTLADTEEKAFQIYNRLAEKYQYSQVTMEELQHIKNLHIKEILEIVDIPLHHFPRVIKEGQKMLKSESSEIHAFNSDIHDFFVAMNKEVEFCGILTSNIKKTVNQFIKKYFLEEEIKFVKCSALMSKADKIRKVLRWSRIKPHEMLYVGDETRDIEACKKVGVDVVAVKWGYNTPKALEQCDPTYMIDNLWDLLDIVKKNQKGFDIKLLSSEVDLEYKKELLEG